MSNEEDIEKTIKEEINASLKKHLPDFAKELDTKFLDFTDDQLFEFITEKNPAINYLCEEIGRTDQEFQAIQNKSK